MKNAALIVVVSCWGYCATAQQQPLLDSLKTALAAAREDTNKVILLDDIAWEYMGMKSEEALTYALQELELATKLKWAQGMAISNQTLGRYYYQNAEYTMAIEYYQAGLKFNDELRNRQAMAVAHLNIGDAWKSVSEYPKALDQYLQALELLEAEKDSSGLILAFNSLAILYTYQKDYPRALEYLEGVRTISEKLNDKEQLAGFYNNYGLICARMEDYDKALECQQKALSINEAIGNHLGVAGNLNNLGNAYLEKDEFPLAMDNYQKALALNKKLENIDWKAKNYANLGKVFYLSVREETTGARQLLSGMFNNNTSAALIQAGMYTDSALQINTTTGNIQSLSTNYEQLSNIKELMGDYSLALSHYKKYTELKDSIFTIEKDRKLTQTSMQYAFDKKEAAARAEQEKRDVTERNVRNSIAGGLVLSLLLLTLVYRQRNNIAKARERAENAERVKQQFLANMSHEIRTPMNSVMGMTELVLNTELQPRQRDYLTKVKKSSENLLHIINDILDLSKIEAGKMELEEIDFSLSDMVDQVKQTLLHKAGEKGLELLTRIDPELQDIVIGDPVRLNQVLINLTGNAIKFTEKGSVLIDLKKDGDTVRFSIIDTGIGIAKDKIGLVFEKFGQANTSDTRKYGGTGLGLSISQQLVTLMGGSIGIDSEEGKGTTFFFNISLKPGSPERYEERIAGVEQVDGSILDGLTILVADDNEYNRIVARDTLLSRANVEVVTAENGQEVLDKLTEKIDIILMDAQMPVLSGFDATRRIRALENPKMKSIPVLALTASVLRTDLDLCKDAGMNGYIPKPFRTHELIVEMAKALNIPIKLLKTRNDAVTDQGRNLPLAEKVTDLSFLAKFCEGDEARMKKYIAIYLNAAPNNLRTIQQSLEHQDFETVQRVVHQLKAHLRFMGMREIADLANSVEDKCMNNPRKEEIAGLVDKISAACTDSFTELSR